jgi:hypothetical protein
LVVVADAGMLSTANLKALEDAGFAFIAQSQISQAPFDLAEHFERHGHYFTDGQILESARLIGTATAERSRRIVYQYPFKRAQQDKREINAMVARAEKVASGDRPLKNDRLVKIQGAWGGLEPRRPRLPARRRVRRVRGQPPPARPQQRLDQEDRQHTAHRQIRDQDGQRRTTHPRARSAPIRPRTAHRTQARR